MTTRPLHTGTYKALHFPLMDWGPNRRAFIMEWMFRNANPDLPTQRSSEEHGWDGIGVIPQFGSESPEARLDRACMACIGPLHRLGFNFASDVIADKRHYKYTEPIELVRMEGDELTLVEFDFGGLNIETPTTDIRRRMNDVRKPGIGRSEVKLLEPASALYLITQWIAYVQSLKINRGRRGRKFPKEPRLRVPTMFVECAGAKYSPFGDSNFNDVPRWDIYPPVGDANGLLFLNWNWDIRSRPLQGVAIAREVR
jgi:hypothetical protein